MNKAEFVSHVATETSSTWAAAERIVGAVFSAIADALVRDESLAIAGFGKLFVRGRAARQGRNPRTGEPVAVPASKVPLFKPAKPFATRSTNSIVRQATTFSHSVSATRPPSRMPSNGMDGIVTPPHEVAHFVKQSVRRTNPRSLDHTWRLVSRGIVRNWMKILQRAELPETAPNVALSGRFS